MSIFLLELTLRLCGFIFIFLQEYRNKVFAKEKGEYSIMCLGESTTNFIFFNYENDYPNQLEMILNKKIKGLDLA